jgi:uncharacterized membrane protein
MMDWTGWGAAGAFAMIVGMLLFAALAVAGLALIFRPVFGNGSQGRDETSNNEPRDRQTRRDNPALAIIEERYARGEIEREEFLALRRGLFDKETPSR